MNTKALLKKMEKANEVTYVKCDFVESLIGVTLDGYMVYWINKKLVDSKKYSSIKTENRLYKLYRCVINR